MKILELAPYAFFEGQEGFTYNTSGLAFVIGDIAVGLAEDNHDVQILTHSAFTSGGVFKNVRILKKKWIDIIKNMKLSSLRYGLRALSGLNTGWKYKMKVVAYFLAQGYVEKIIRQNKPDFVHIHTIGFYSLPYMLACIACDVPFAVSLHGRISHVPKGSIDEKQRSMEKKFCVLASDKNIPVSVISTGIKNKLTEEFHLKEDILTVVLNGVPNMMSQLDSRMTTDIRHRYSIGNDDIVFVCVGSLSEQKNQSQIVRAYKKLNPEIRNRVKILLVGNGPMYNILKDVIHDNDVENNVFCCGFVNHDQLPAYYQIADYHITASVDEGFGLLIIEGFQFGLPTVTFDDLDAVPDLKCGNSLFLANERTDAALANAMQQAIEVSVDKDELKSLAEKFTRKAMTEAYVEFFKNNMSTKSELIKEDILKLL